MPGQAPEPGLDLSRAIYLIILITVTIAMAVILGTGVLPPGGLSGPTSTITGSVTIGPLCPVEPCTPSPEQLAEAYGARRIVIASPDGAIAAEAVPDPVNGYTVHVKPGTYIVDIGHSGRDRSMDLPKTVTVAAGATARVDIRIDTGLR
jgi:hypothetical protein